MVYYRSPSGVILSAGAHGVIPPACILCVRRLPDYTALWSGLTRQWGTLSAPNLGEREEVVNKYHVPRETKRSKRTKLAGEQTVVIQEQSGSSQNVPRLECRLHEREYAVETGRERARKKRRHSSDSLRTVSVRNKEKFEGYNPNLFTEESSSGGMSDPGKGGNVACSDEESCDSFFTQTC